MPRFVIELIEEDGQPNTNERRYFGHARGDRYVTMHATPWEIEATCFYDAVVKMWCMRLEENGDLPRVMRFDPHHQRNSDMVRMWRWNERELIQVKKCS